MSASEILAATLLVSFVALLFTGFPVAWVLGGLAVLFTAIGIVARVDFGVEDLTVDWGMTSLVVERMWDVMSNWVLVALPLFIFMGLMLERSDVARTMLVALSRLLGRVRGGLAVAVALIGILLAASTGIVGASVTLLALLGLPAMLERRYDPELATGICAAVGTLGILIPPSIMLVVMGDRLALPVGDLFLGALVPGLLLGAAYVAWILFAVRGRADLAPADSAPEGSALALVLRSHLAVVPALGLIVAVLGSIFLGVATPTEAAGLGAFGATLLAALHGKLDRAVLRDTSLRTTRTTAYIFAIILGATAFSLVLRSLGGDRLIEHALVSLPFGPTGTVIAILFGCFLLGFVLDWIEITLVVLPLVAPVIARLGFDPIWFAVLFAVVLQTSFLTPPVGFSLFYVKGVAPPGITTLQIYRGAIPFNAIILVVLALCFAFEDLVLWLPRAAYGP